MNPERLKSRPEDYAADFLRVKWTPDQINVAQSLIKHKRVLVLSGHSTGKSHMAGGLINWFYDTRNPSTTLSTAPNAAQVQDVIWKEVRSQRRRMGEAFMNVLKPSAPRMEDAEDHVAVGYTASDATSFQGRKNESIFFLFDEAVAIAPEFWDAAEGMLSGDDWYWVCFMNPTTTSCRAWQEDMKVDKNGKPRWHTINLSCLSHPNVVAEVRMKQEGRTQEYITANMPFREAVMRLEWVEDKLASWCSSIRPDERTPVDFEFPIGSGHWYRPSPQAEARLLGRWPTQSDDSVWTTAMWEAAVRNKDFGYKPILEDPNDPIEIGCDVARGGQDYTVIIVRRGPIVLHHERHNGWDTKQTAKHLQKLATEMGNKIGQIPTKIAIKVDDANVGGGVVDQRDNFNFIGINAASRALDPEHYPNRRSELWFDVADRAQDMEIDFSQLSDDSREMLKSQLLAPKWKPDRGRRVVEAKDITRKNIGISPDDADALNLAFAKANRMDVILSAEAKKMLANWNAGKPVGNAIQRDPYNDLTW